ncbi:MAG: glycosyltransferase N-terminal domain-containing protein [Candidatus Omnitrophota bacterium]
MLYLIYNFIFLLGLIIYLPIYFWRGKIDFSALKQKLGFIPQIEGGQAIWIQAVSVGEVILVEDLVKEVKEIYNCPIVISTTTLTGNKIAREKYLSLAKVIFFPLDMSFILRRVLKKIRPKIFIAVETEIWPNLFKFLSKKNVPIVMINARISDKAFSRYKIIKFFMKRILNKCNYIGVQNQTYKERFVFLGAKENKVIVSGNMKLGGVVVDTQSFARDRAKYLPILKKENSLLLIAASTHSPEESIIIKIYSDIIKVSDKVTLLIAPRHPNRAGEIEKIVKSNGFNPIKMSKVDLSYGLVSKGMAKRVYIADTIGQLMFFYSISDICFVGKSLVCYGGQNILEPVYFSKPTVFGPNMSNFAEIERVVLEKKAGIRVKNEQELKEVLLKLVQDEPLRDSLSKRCPEVFEKGKQSLESNLGLIFKCL